MAGHGSALHRTRWLEDYTMSHSTLGSCSCWPCYLPQPQTEAPPGHPRVLEAMGTRTGPLGSRYIKRGAPARPLRLAQGGQAQAGEDLPLRGVKLEQQARVQPKWE